MTGGASPVVLTPVEDVTLRLFAFPHAGGGPNGFADWSSGLPDDVEIVSYTLPGRGQLRDRRPHRRWRSLIGDLAELVGRHDDGAPFAFFGHSFGALVAFEVCRELTRKRLRLPRVLFLSAHRAPHLVPERVLHDLPEDRFRDIVRQWGLVPGDLLENEELLRLIIPPLREDLRLDEEYRCRTGFETGRRLPTSCVLFGGADDLTVSPDELRPWRCHFDDDASFDLEILPGGHFYTIDSRGALLDSIGGHLDRVRSEVGPSITITQRHEAGAGRGLWDRFGEQVVSSPDSLALADGPRQWSYRGLGEATTRLAADLAALGVTQGDVVGILLPHSADYCISLLACCGIGAPACLLETSWPASLLSQFLDSADVRVVATTPDLAERLPPRFRIPGGVLILDGEARTGPHGSHAAAGFGEVDPSKVALISMTSGTSGTPKPVLNTYRGCMYCFDARFELYPYQESSRDGLNVFFGWECLRPLLQGMPAVVIPDQDLFDPTRLVDTIEQSGITRVVVTPSLFESVLDHPSAGPTLTARLGHMEIIFLMGEVVPARIVDKARALLPAHLRLVNAYSTWESLDVSYADLLPWPAGRASQSRPFAPVGRILAGSAAAVLNANGHPVPRGGVGELYFSSPGVALGYLGDPDKTTERFVPCPPALGDSPFAGQTFYRTGDRARFLPDGGLEILGRSGDIVKLRGFKVSLRSVENVLEDQDGVSRAIVRPVLDDLTMQPTSLVAYIVGEDGRPSDTVLARSRRRVRRDLPEYARPREFIGLGELPIGRGDSRKIDLTALPAPHRNPAAAEPGDTAALSLTAMERRIAQAWTEVLGVAAIAPDDNFFEVGGDSLRASRLSGLLGERYGIRIPVVDVFQFSTLAEMARHCSAEREPGAERLAARTRKFQNGTAGQVLTPAGLGNGSGRAGLAIVGMAGRFPGARDITAFWENLKNGVDSLTTFAPEQLRAKEVGEEVLSHPNWVPAGQMLDDPDKFDADFWGIGRREAVTMDPQHRVFIEVAWSALEQAGYARRNNPYRRRTGVFAACGIDGYLIHHLQGGGLRAPLDPAGLFLTEIGNEKDYIATRVAYLMDLGGPAITVTSACSSALVAVAQAAQSIATGQCDMAIAGASSITFPNLGYCYEEGLVGSVDGHVRPFDEAASGTLFGDSVGAVVLKRLDEAIADGDHIWAILTGYGVSNDGRMKAGYTAPNARAQAQCISDALAMTGIGSEHLSYVECHATATHVGDAIEIKGLLDAFGRHRENAGLPPGWCRIGSVKGNIGHANCAAGITGLIKTVLCLHHRTLVPTVNYRTLNPKLVDLVDCDDSPFAVQQATQEWTVAHEATQLPRRAGVSSFGIGGTNAHVILEEATPIRREEPDPADPRSLHLVTVSARSEGALRRNAQALARFVEGLPDDKLAAAIRWLHLSRESHPLRSCAVLERGSGSGPDVLCRLGERLSRSALRRGDATTVAFCFSGQGSQTPGMARGLYRGRADGGRFRRHFDAACESLARHLGADPAALILNADEESVMRPLTTQCGLFAVEYALAATLTDIGIRPVAVAGHSIGEYCAAVISGLLTLDEAAALVAVRAQATEDLLPAATDGTPAGGMLSVVGDQDLLTDWLSAGADIWCAAENAPGRTVLSGTPAALRRASEELPALGFTCRAVPVSHPFHSVLMAPVAERLSAAASGVPVRTPAVPMASNLTGSWLDSRYRPGVYWREHLTSKVQWRGDVNTLLNWDPGIILEVGPGDVLTTLVAKCLTETGRHDCHPIAAMPGARDPDEDDEAGLLAVIGRLWGHGVEVDFEAFHAGQSRENAGVAHLLPTYRFDPASHWTRPEASAYVTVPDVTVPDVTVAESGSCAGTETAAAVPGTTRRLVRFAERPGARLRLYCFPYAGGNAGTFRSWAAAAAPWIDLVAVQSPARDGYCDGDPAGQQLRGDPGAVAQLAAEIRADAGSAAVAFCGLSFGASLAFDLLSGPLADWARGGRITAVSVVGRAPIRRDCAAAQSSPDAYLMVPEGVRADAEWRRTTLPALEADLAFDAGCARRIIDRRERDQRPVIDCPVQVHCGTEDSSFPRSLASDWAAVTTSPIVDMHSHPGSHEFMLHHRERILERLLAFLDRLQTPPDTPDTGILHSVRWVPVARPADCAEQEGISWLDADQASPEESARFLNEGLTGPDSTVALVCPASADRTPGERGQRYLTMFASLARAQPRGQVILVLPAAQSAGLPAGMARSLVLEQPGLEVRRVYVHGRPLRLPPCRGEGSGWIDELLMQVRQYPGETDLLYRGGHLLAQRLRPFTAPQLPPRTLAAADGSYLICGGTGGIGRVITDWLIHNQGVEPGRVLISGRRAPRDLRRGVGFVRLDLAHPPDVDALAARTGPLAGIIHLAGSLDDGLVQNLDPARLPAVLAPKLAVTGLAELGRRTGASWVTAFSSTSALLGAPGQSTYAAANAWMDFCAMWTASEGGPSVVSINWGTWADVGMAARNVKALRAARAAGETPLTTAAALACFGRVIASVLHGHPEQANVVICDVDWRRSPWSRQPLITGLPLPASREPTLNDAPQRYPPDPADTDGENDRIRSFLGTFISQWDESERLADLGLDSLDFVRIKGDFVKRFGADVPLSAIAKPGLRLRGLRLLLSHALEPDASARVRP
jgi:acyl transferase domain-containing protein/surfactin synthase thioesterase subunit/non-ribosomal peptide synthetase component F/acyl carrier protein